MSTGCDDRRVNLVDIHTNLRSRTRSYLLDVLNGVELVAWVDTLRRVASEEINIHLHAADLLDNRNALVLGNAGINGRFVNYEDTAIENADIYINGTLVASTDENGHFRFKMKSGSYIMEIRYAYGFTRYVGLSITDHDIVLDDKQAIKMIACDFNKDGKIDAADQSLFTLVIFSKKGDASYLKFVDLNNDGCINAKDYIIIEKLIGTDSLTYSYPELTIA